MSNRLLNNLLPRFYRQSNRILNKVWPRQCFVCAEHAGSEAVCDACAKTLPYFLQAHCPVCALPSPGNQVCGRCIKRAPHFNATRAVFAYEHPIREMLLLFKAGAGFHVLDWLAAALAVGRSGIDAHCIIPMPLHNNRLAERGFNQSLELARTLAEESGWPLLTNEVLRDIDTPHQTGLRAKERQRNVRGAFRCVRRFDGQHVLIVDDVMTSGSSLNELARTLKLAGAERVTNLVVARTLARPRK